jgi:NADPH:quinone reductase-like Zn-dependent oxidoreductase
MKAIVSPKYGQPDVLEYKDVEKPTTKDDEVLVNVHAVSINQYDWHLLTADIFLVRLNMGFWKPKHPIPGADIAGRVEAIGRNVTQFRPGDQVFGDIAARGAGGMAEYVAVPEKLLALKPKNMSFEEAAAVPMAGLTALQGLRDVGKIQAGQKVLIQGAAGGVGTFAVQIAKSFDAEVTAVCSTRNMDQARSLGADHVIDYTRDDFADGARRYDLILDVGGNPAVSRLRRALEPTGTVVFVGGEDGGGLTGGMGRQVRAVVLSLFVHQRLAMCAAKERAVDLERLIPMLETGAVVPAVDRSYPLDGVPEAMRHLEAGQVRGKIAIALAGRAASH